MTLSIIICSINDQDETIATIKSIRQTAGNEPEIVVVDDCSGNAMSGDWRFKNIPNFKLVSNALRCGCGPSRHIGALHASGDWLLITDSHMRFTEGWYQAAQRKTKDTPNTLWCSTCLALDQQHLDPNHPVSEYMGATFNWHGPDRHPKVNRTQTLEVVWIKPGELPQHDGAEIPAVMGAGYFISRAWFLHLAPTRFLRTWGSDELFLSMKSWLAGGNVRLMRDVRIGHLFPRAGAFKTFNVPMGHIHFNKLLAAHTLFPPDVAKRLVEWVLNPQDKNEAREIEAARRLAREDWHIIAQERAYNERLFALNHSAICQKLGLPMP